MKNTYTICNSVPVRRAQEVVYKAVRARFGRRERARVERFAVHPAGEG